MVPHWLLIASGTRHRHSTARHGHTGYRLIIPCYAAAQPPDRSDVTSRFLCRSVLAVEATWVTRYNNVLVSSTIHMANRDQGWEMLGLSTASVACRSGEYERASDHREEECLCSVAWTRQRPPSILYRISYFRIDDALWLLAENPTQAALIHTLYV